MSSVGGGIQDWMKNLRGNVNTQGKEGIAFYQGQIPGGPGQPMQTGAQFPVGTAPPMTSGALGDAFNVGSGQTPMGGQIDQFGMINQPQQTGGTTGQQGWGDRPVNPGDPGYGQGWVSGNPAYAAPSGTPAVASAPGEDVMWNTSPGGQGIVSGRQDAFNPTSGSGAATPFGGLSGVSITGKPWNIGVHSGGHEYPGSGQQTGGQRGPGEQDSFNPAGGQQTGGFDAFGPTAQAPGGVYTSPGRGTAQYLNMYPGGQQTGGTGGGQADPLMDRIGNGQLGRAPGDNPWTPTPPGAPFSPQGALEQKLGHSINQPDPMAQSVLYGGGPGDMMGQMPDMGGMMGGAGTAQAGPTEPALGPGLAGQEGQFPTTPGLTSGMTSPGTGANIPDMPGMPGEDASPGMPGGDPDWKEAGTFDPSKWEQLPDGTFRQKGAGVSGPEGELDQKKGPFGGNLGWDGPDNIAEKKPGDWSSWKRLKKFSPLSKKFMGRGQLPAFQSQTEDRTLPYDQLLEKYKGIGGDQMTSQLAAMIHKAGVFEWSKTQKSKYFQTDWSVIGHKPGQWYERKGDAIVSIDKKDIPEKRDYSPGHDLGPMPKRGAFSTHEKWQAALMDWRKGIKPEAEEPAQAAPGQVPPQQPADQQAPVEGGQIYEGMPDVQVPGLTPGLGGEEIEVGPGTTVSGAPGTDVSTFGAGEAIGQPFQEDDERSQFNLAGGTIQRDEEGNEYWRDSSGRIVKQQKVEEPAQDAGRDPSLLNYKEGIGGGIRDDRGRDYEPESAGEKEPGFGRLLSPLRISFEEIGGASSDWSYPGPHQSGTNSSALRQSREIATNRMQGSLQGLRYLEGGDTGQVSRRSDIFNSIVRNLAGGPPRDNQGNPIQMSTQQRREWFNEQKEKFGKWAEDAIEKAIGGDAEGAHKILQDQFLEFTMNRHGWFRQQADQPPADQPPVEQPVEDQPPVEQPVDETGGIYEGMPDADVAGSVDPGTGDEGWEIDPGLAADPGQVQPGQVDPGQDQLPDGAIAPGGVFEGVTAPPAQGLVASWRPVVVDGRVVAWDGVGANGATISDSRIQVDQPGQDQPVQDQPGGQLAPRIGNDQSDIELMESGGVPPGVGWVTGEGFTFYDEQGVKRRWNPGDPAPPQRQDPGQPVEDQPVQDGGQVWPGTVTPGAGTVTPGVTEPFIPDTTTPPGTGQPLDQADLEALNGWIQQLVNSGWDLEDAWRVATGITQEDVNAPVYGGDLIQRMVNQGAAQQRKSLKYETERGAGRGISTGAGMVHQYGLPQMAASLGLRRSALQKIPYMAQMENVRRRTEMAKKRHGEFLGWADLLRRQWYNQQQMNLTLQGINQQGQFNMMQQLGPIFQSLLG